MVKKILHHVGFESEVSFLAHNFLATPPTQHMRLYMGCLPFEINHGRHFSPDWWYQSGLKRDQRALSSPTMLELGQI